MKKSIGRILALVLVIALCGVMFAACVPSDPAKARANLEDAGYIITPSLSGLFGSLGIESSKYESVIAATNGDEAISIIYFKDAADAKELYDDMKAERKEYLEELKKMRDDGDISKDEYKEMKEDINSTKIGRSGKVVWTGTKQAVKDAR